MGIHEFLYDIILIIIQVVVAATACCLYFLRKDSLFPPIIGLFTIYLIDTAVIWMTEAVPEFEMWYNLSFMNSPTIKTLLYLCMALFSILFWNCLVNKRVRLSGAQIAILVTLALWFFLVPLMPHNSTEVYLYYIGYQIFNVLACIYAIVYIRKVRDSNENDTSSAFIVTNRKWLLFIFIITLIGSVAIQIEDTYVIYNVDVYAQTGLFIHNRNTSEDILRAIYAISLLWQIYRYWAPSISKTAFIPAKEDVPAPAFNPLNAEDYRRHKFSKSLGLTEREAEILNLLLDGKSNTEISDALVISQGTVKAHIHNIFQKSNITRRRELLAKYQEFEQ